MSEERKIEIIEKIKEIPHDAIDLIEKLEVVVGLKKAAPTQTNGEPANGEPTPEPTPEPAEPEQAANSETPQVVS